MGIGLIATGVVNDIFSFSTSRCGPLAAMGIERLSRVWIAGLRRLLTAVLAYRARRLVVWNFRTQCRRGADHLSLWPLSPCIMAGASGMMVAGLLAGVSMVLCWWLLRPSAGGGLPPVGETGGTMRWRLLNSKRARG